MPRTTKQRPLPFEVDDSKVELTDISSGGKHFEETGATVVNGIQVTESEGHYRPGGKSSVLGGDVGGDFFSQKKSILGVENTISADFLNWNGSTRYNGRFNWFPIHPAAGTFPPSLSSSDDELDEIGATAISRCKPTKSTASFSTALGELFRDGLPNLVGHSLWKDRTHKLRQNAGSEFLNVEFGWNPLLHDVRKFAGGVKDIGKLARQYERDAGRPVRRKYRFPTVYSGSPETLVESGGDYSKREWIDPWNSQVWKDVGPAPAYYIDFSTVDRWFEGVFSYAIPGGTVSSLNKHVSAASQVLGLVPDPETLWNLAPWSWALDWFSNTGDVISNVNDWATDGLVTRYGYVMEHSVTKRIYYNKSSGFRGTDSRTAAGLVFTTETKRRRRANPFGFGLNWDGLSPIQLAISAALGLSKS